MEGLQGGREDRRCSLLGFWGFVHRPGAPHEWPAVSCSSALVPVQCVPPPPWSCLGSSQHAMSTSMQASQLASWCQDKGQPMGHKCGLNPTSDPLPSEASTSIYKQWWDLFNNRFSKNSEKNFQVFHLPMKLDKLFSLIKEVNHPTAVSNETYQERLSRLEGDKESLILQVSVLTDQVEAQGEKIRDLEVCLEGHQLKLNATEEMLQQVGKDMELL
uniref:Uncharacterized protein n=1 Tax=Sphaerodactylus townsendi TaxID=933632 RepID=A0ACB8G3E6_9SAUR